MRVHNIHWEQDTSERHRLICRFQHHLRVGLYLLCKCGTVPNSVAVSPAVPHLNILPRACVHFLFASRLNCKRGHVGLLSPMSAFIRRPAKLCMFLLNAPSGKRESENQGQRMSAGHTLWIAVKKRGLCVCWAESSGRRGAD